MHNLVLTKCVFSSSRYIVAFLMIWYLNKKTVLSFPSMETLHFGGYLKSGEFLLLIWLVWTQSSLTF